MNQVNSTDMHWNDTDWEFKILFYDVDAVALYIM